LTTPKTKTVLAYQNKNISDSEILHILKSSNILYQVYVNDV